MDMYTTNQPIGSTCSNKLLTPTGVQMPSFCKACGAPLSLFEQGYYDEYTGKKVFKWGCSRMGCEEHCYIRGGHRFKGKYWFPIPYVAACKDCGYEPQDY